MLTDKAMNRIDARRMVQRRSAGHGMRIAAHTFSPPASLPISKPAGRSRTRKSWPRMKAAQTLPSHRRRNVRFRPQIESKGRAICIGSSTSRRDVADRRGVDAVRRGKNVPLVQNQASSCQA
jgi:hypothetical protein